MDEQKFATLNNWQITWMLIKAPIMGALFVMFLPVIGFVIFGKFGVDKAVEVMRKRFKHGDKHTAGVV